MVYAENDSPTGKPEETHGISTQPSSAAEKDYQHVINVRKTEKNLLEDTNDSLEDNSETLS